MVGCICQALLCFVGVGLITSSMDADPRSNEQVSSREEGIVDVDEAMRCCGRSSLYVWLRLSGYDVSYKEVSENVPVSERGTSLSALACASTHWFSGLSIIKAQSSDLHRVVLPAIVHVWLGGRPESEGHYMVLLKVKSATIIYADPSRFRGIREMPQEDFLRIWSGYLLVRSDSIGVWTDRALIFGLIAAPLCGFLLLRPFLFRHRKATQSLLSLVLLPLSLIVCGCNREMPMGSGDVVENSVQNAISKPTRLTQPLKTSARKQNLGVLPLGAEARGVFTLSNVTNRAIELRLGTPSCACLKAELSKDHLEPRESATLELLLRGSRRAAGPASGAVQVGTIEPESTLLFSAEGIVEGLTTMPYSMRLPRDLARFSPDPIYGEIAVGVDHTKAKIKIDCVDCLGAKANSIELGIPVVSAMENLGLYARCRFQIPVRLVQNRRPETNVYPVRIVYQIDGKTGEHDFVLNVFPSAEQSPLSAR